MKSGGGSSTPPNMPQPQGNIVPYGQASPAGPPYQSFLPTDPNAMATEMPAQPLQQAAPPQQQPPMDMNALRAALAQMMARNTPPRDTNPSAALSPFGASSNSGGGYQSMRAGPMVNRGRSR